ncbi:MAG TPA: 2-phospho-L-lactate transferase [Dehalococcoidia bacterium]|nr:2-phospho-L-lactate transferase [Dehalococcoidia bacterium]
MIAVLCGGVGGSRFMRALSSVVAPERLTAIVNTGDDEWFHGLYVSPDPDIVTYALAGEVDEERGWGLRGDTFRWLGEMGRYGEETWFRIGDRDLATHLHRTRLLHAGWPLSRIAADIARAFGVGARVLPMSDDTVRTVVETDAGAFAFQEYLVKRQARDAVRAVRFDGAAAARLGPGVLDAISAAEAILIAPSNPIGSIGPILAIPGIREAIAGSAARRVAVSPIIGGRSLQPPAGEMMAGLGHTADVAGVAAIYAGLVDTLVIDTADGGRERDVAGAGVRALVTPTVMRDEGTRRALGAAVRAELGLS